MDGDRWIDNERVGAHRSSVNSAIVDVLLSFPTPSTNVANFGGALFHAGLILSNRTSSTPKVPRWTVL